MGWYMNRVWTSLKIKVNKSVIIDVSSDVLKVQKNSDNSKSNFSNNTLNFAKTICAKTTIDVEPFKVDPVLCFEMKPNNYDYINTTDPKKCLRHACSQYFA